MSNSITAFNPAFWSRTMQEVFFKENVAIGLANTEMRSYLNEGDVVHKPYRGSLIDQAYTKGTDISTFNDLTSTDEYLTVDTTRVVPFYVDDIDRIQNRWDAATVFAGDAMRVLNNKLDQVVLGQYSNARGYISAQDLGGSGTGSIAITQSNIPNMFAVGFRKLAEVDAPTNNLVAVVGPRTLETLKLYVGGRETGFGETVSDNGKVGRRFGFDIVESNNVPFTAVITIDDTPHDGESIIIGGVTLTWEATGTNCSTAGEMDIESSASGAGDNLALMINGTTAGTTGTYCDVAAGDRWKFRKHGLSASNNAGVVTITGYGDVSFNMNSATHCTLTSLTQYPVFMKRGAIDLVVQKSPSVEFRVAEKRLGRYVYPWMMYGVKTFESNKDCMTYVKVDARAWV